LLGYLYVHYVICDPLGEKVPNMGFWLKNTSQKVPSSTFKLQNFSSVCNI